MALASNDISAFSYVARPSSGIGPAVMVLAEPSDAVRAFCDRLAEDDYLVGCLGPAAGKLTAPHCAAALDALMSESGTDSIGMICLDGNPQLAWQLAASARIDALVIFGDETVIPERAALNGVAIPMVIHAAGPIGAAQATHVEGLKDLVNVRVCSYPAQQPGFAQPGHAAYDRINASLAYSRSLAILRRVLGPQYDLAALFSEHLRQEFMCRDADATMETMVDRPYVNHIPTMTGGVGHDMLKRFYKYHFIPCLPRNRVNIIISEIVGADTVVIEGINCFTHDQVIDHILPGIAPTGKYMEMPFVALAKFKGRKLYYEHIYWDQAGLLAQAGLLDPAGLPIAGIEQAQKVRDITRPSNTLMPTWKDSEGKDI